MLNLDNINTMSITNTHSMFNLPYGVLWSFSLILIPLYFTLSILIEQSKVIQGEKPAFHIVIFKTIALFLVFMLYKQIFTFCSGVFETIASGLYSVKDWEAYRNKLIVVQGKIGSNGISNSSILQVISVLSVSFAILVEYVFLLCRYYLISLLYIIGPFTLVWSLFTPTSKFFKGWLLLFVQLSFWIILFRLTQFMLVSKGVVDMVASGNVVYILIASFCTILFTTLIPILTYLFVSKDNIISSTNVMVSSYNNIRNKAVVSNVRNNMLSSIKSFNDRITTKTEPTENISNTEKMSSEIKHKE